MALTMDTVAEHIKPLTGAITRRFTCGSTVVAGTPVTMSSDGFVDPSDASDVTLSFVAGIAVQGGVVGDRIDVVVFGPIICVTGMTIGGLVYLSDTVGEMSQTAGTKTTIIGWAETAAVIFVNIKYVSLS
jgi:hypothetical protein